jgi:hypothetical protein
VEAHANHFKLCAACKTVVYCSKAHQAEDWPACTRRRARRRARRRPRLRRAAAPRDVRRVACTAGVRMALRLYRTALPSRCDASSSFWSVWCVNRRDCGCPVCSSRADGESHPDAWHAGSHSARRQVRRRPGLVVAPAERVLILAGKRNWDRQPANNKNNQSRSASRRRLQQAARCAPRCCMGCRVCARAGARLRATARRSVFAAVPPGSSNALLTPECLCCSALARAACCAARRSRQQGAPRDVCVRCVRRAAAANAARERSSRAGAAWRVRSSASNTPCVVMRARVFCRPASALRALSPAAPQRGYQHAARRVSLDDNCALRVAQRRRSSGRRRAARLASVLPSYCHARSLHSRRAPAHADPQPWRPSPCPRRASGPTAPSTSLLRPAAPFAVRSRHILLHGPSRAHPLFRAAPAISAVCPRVPWLFPPPLRLRARP